MIVVSVERWRARHSVMAAQLSACGMAAASPHAADKVGDLCV